MDDLLSETNTVNNLEGPSILPSEMGIQETNVGGASSAPGLVEKPRNVEIPSKTLKEISADAHKEILDGFAGSGYPLNDTLVDMLSESQEHQGGRRGSGFTQASRVLASKFINSPRSDRDIALFGASVKSKIDEEFDAIYWALPPDDRDSFAEPDYLSRVDKGSIAQLPKQMQNEESRLVAQMIVDIIDPVDANDASVPLPSMKEDMRIGTCTTSEAYFCDYLEKGRPFPHPGAKINIIVNQDGQAVMLEKIGLGENHSALTLVPTLLNGVRLPPGSLVGVQYPKGVEKPGDKDGSVIGLQDCQGIKFLRLSSFAADPSIRERTFGSLMQFQRESGMRDADTLRIKNFQDKAQQRLISASLAAV